MSWDKSKYKELNEKLELLKKQKKENALITYKYYKPKI